MTTEINGRKILFENEQTLHIGIPASCNGCDRIIFEDEMAAQEYADAGGYCPDCIKAREEEEK